MRYTRTNRATIGALTRIIGTLTGIIGTLTGIIGTLTRIIGALTRIIGTGIAITRTVKCDYRHRYCRAIPEGER